MSKTKAAWLAAGILLIFLSLLSYQVLAKRKTWRNERAHSAQEMGLIAAPKDEEVCFSPEEACDLKLIKFLQSAKMSVDIAVYDVTLHPLVAEIVKIANRLPVRVVVDQRQAHEKNSLVASLIEAGVPLRYGHQPGIMHNKFMIVDRAHLETGSFNYTNHASLANNENQIYLDKINIVNRFEKRFEKIWREAD